jgi:phage tail sheath protein FI
MTDYKTPGVYVVEKNAFPNSVVEVETAIPAFIGYTERALQGKTDVTNKAIRLTSLRDYEAIFGGPPVTPLAFVDASKPSTSALKYPDQRFLLYYGMRLFFDNGGGPCYVISVGDYTNGIDPNKLWDANDMIRDALRRELEPTMIVIPDATQLAGADWKGLSEKVLLHCVEMMSRITILDVVGGDRPGADGESVSNLIRDHANQLRAVTGDKLSYGVAYYPWLNSTIVGDADVDFRSLDADARPALFDAVKKGAQTDFEKDPAKIEAINHAADTIAGFTFTDLQPLPSAIQHSHQVLLRASPVYKDVMAAIRPKLNLLPPSMAMAGVYTRIDNEFGVFRAPANTGLISVASPSISITHAEQEDLNMPLDGKAINAIRALPGRGLMVWGARTLDGNSQDWKYVNVRRTMIMLEQSIKAAAQAYVFQPNTPTTWVTVRSMIVNYLTNKWKDGALMGVTPDEAFSVDVGLGSTMSANDILDGYMRVTVKVAIVRPAEFIELTFVQKMQTAA